MVFININDDYPSAYCPQRISHHLAVGVGEVITEPDKATRQTQGADRIDKFALA